jgi:hypothetical protein
MARLLLGDSNIIRYLPMLKEKKSDPAIQSVVLARATNAVALQDSLCNPKTAHTTVIVSAITNLLTSKYFDDFDDMTAHCKTVFNDLLLWIQEGREALDGFAQQVTIMFTLSISALSQEPKLASILQSHQRVLLLFWLASCPVRKQVFLLLQVLIMPPMLRRQPYWYDRWHGAIMIIFESIYHHPHVANVFVLPSFSNPAYGPDCVHLTEKSGLE